MPNTSTSGTSTSEAVSSLDLNLVISDRNILAYLAEFEDEEIQCEKALEAMKVGVIAIRTASPISDTEVVKDKFAEVEARMKEQWVNSRRKRQTILSVTVIVMIIYN